MTNEAEWELFMEDEITLETELSNVGCVSSWNGGGTLQIIQIGVYLPSKEKEGLDEKTEENVGTGGWL